MREGRAAEARRAVIPAACIERERVEAAERAEREERARRAAEEVRLAAERKVQDDLSVATLEKTKRPCINIKGACLARIEKNGGW